MGLIPEEAKIAWAGSIHRDSWASIPTVRVFQGKTPYECFPQNRTEACGIGELKPVF